MTEHYEPKTELRDGMRIDWDVRITMSDGVSLAADAFGLAEQPPSGQQQAEFTARSEGLMFRLPAFEHDVEFTGPAALKLFVSSTTEDADACYIAYSGPCDVDETNQTVAHHVQVPVIPSWLGTTQLRQVRFHGPDTLALSVSEPGGDEVMSTTTISWARQPP